MRREEETPCIQPTKLCNWQRKLVGFLKSGIHDTHGRTEWTERNLRLLDRRALLALGKEPPAVLSGGRTRDSQ